MSRGVEECGMRVRAGEWHGCMMSRCVEECGMGMVMGVAWVYDESGRRGVWHEWHAWKGRGVAWVYGRGSDMRVLTGGAQVRGNPKPQTLSPKPGVNRRSASERKP